MDNRKWYQKKRYLIPAGIILFLILLSLFGGTSEQPTKQVDTLEAPKVEDPETTEAVNLEINNTDGTQQLPSTALSNDNYYINVDGNTVHSPAYAPSIPAGATAKCRDGTYSFSQHRSGTCSHHGGVLIWY